MREKPYRQAKTSAQLLMIAKGFKGSRVQDKIRKRVQGSEGSRKIRIRLQGFEDSRGQGVEKNENKGPRIRGVKE